MDESQDIEHQKTVIRDAAANFFVGGADTSVSSINTFVLAMTRWPEIQAKAQAEIDRVLGPNVLPDFSDEDSLPYITAIVKEVLRWNTVTPMGMCSRSSTLPTTLNVPTPAIPHYLTEDDEYNGYFLPAGSIVAGNAWWVISFQARQAYANRCHRAMLHDKDIYPDPLAFKPERWLTADGRLNPDVVEPTAAFGFGRR
jgi:cytochrome P450